MTDDRQNILHILDELIARTNRKDKDKSYTAYLLDAGQDKMVAKFLEEANELTQAVCEAGYNDKKHIIYEGADVLYHFLVLLRGHNVSLKEVLEELEQRRKVSGFAEKASRTSS